VRRWQARLLCVLLALPACASAVVESEFFNAAGVAFPTLSVPVGVRATGMGDAYTASGDDVYALNWNPAGLARMSGYQLGLADNEWSTELGLRQEFLAYGQQILGGGMAFSLNYFNLGQLDQRDSSGALIGHSNASAFAADLGYAFSMLDQGRLKLGLAAEFGSQSLYGISQAEYGANVGLLYELSSTYSAGFSANHLGGGSQGFSPPESLSLGLAGTFFTGSLVAALDGQMPLNSDTVLGLGLEYTWSALSLRCGWRQSLGAPDGSVQSGLTAGAGFRVGRFRLDYSYVPYSDLSTSQRVQATVELPNGFFAPRIIAPEMSSATAEAYYNLGLGFEKDGETLKALIQFERCIESYPESLKAAPQDFYLQAVKKAADLQASMNKGGDHRQIQKLTKENLASADRELKAGHFRDAIDLLKQAKKIDPNNPLIDKMIQDAKDAMQQKLGVYRDAAHFGATEHNLSMCVENYKKLLSIDPADAEALAYMDKHRSELKALLQSMDRKGIFFYVGGSMDEAVKVWAEGQALDYFGDIDFKRDLDKARKQQEQLQGK
jgi:tetratricopeptide (TPR) repeat protein